MKQSLIDSERLAVKLFKAIMVVKDARKNLLANVYHTYGSRTAAIGQLNQAESSLANLVLVYQSQILATITDKEFQDEAERDHTQLEGQAATGSDPGPVEPTG